MSTRGALILLLLVLPALALLAFGPRQAREVPPDRTVIRYWEKWTGVEGAVMKRIVAEYNASQGAADGIYVDYLAVSSVDQRTLVAVAGGDPPDLAGLYDHVIAQFADREALMELDELVREFGIEADAFKPAWWNIGVYNDRLYALPSTPYTIALFYNKRLFREAGLDPDRPPRTLAELDAYSRRLTRRAKDGRILQAGFIPAPKLLGWWHWVWLYFFGGNLWDGEQFTLDTPAGRAAHHWMYEQRSEMGFPEAIAFESNVGAVEGPLNPFLAERLAMVYQGPWVANWVRRYKPSLEYGVARFPAHRPDRHPVFVSSDVFVIPRGSPHPRQAMQFLRYVLRQDVLERLCREHWKLSPFRKPGRDFFENHPIREHIRTLDALADSQDVFGYPRMPTWAEASVEMLYMVENILQGHRPPDQALRETQAKIDKMVIGYQRMAARRQAAPTTP
jgi:ABC-type glycerol-3-phosphate transport system substrate-binding protein